MQASKSSVDGGGHLGNAHRLPAGNHILARSYYGRVIGERKKDQRIREY